MTNASRDGRRGSLNSRTKLVEVAPFLSDLPLDLRREAATAVSTKGERTKPISQLRVRDVADPNKRRSLSEILARAALEFEPNRSIRKLLPTLSALKGTFIGHNDLSSRTYKVLLRSNLLQWDDLGEVSAQDLLQLQGIGRSGASEVLSLAINRSLKTSIDSHALLASQGSETYALDRGPINRELVVDLLLDFVNRLPASSLAMDQTGQARQVLLDWGRSANLGKLRQLIAGAEGVEALPPELTTRKRRRILEQSLSEFDGKIELWMRNSPWDNKVKWLVPAGSLRVLSQANEKRLRTLLRESSPLGQRLSVADGVAVWSPLLSIDLVVSLKKLRRSDPPELLTALARATNQVCPGSSTKPWNPQFPARLSALPLVWLYQYAPNDRINTVIRRFEHAGAANVGTLRLLHPECMTLIRSSTLEQWIELRRHLAN